LIDRRFSVSIGTHFCENRYNSLVLGNAGTVASRRETMLNLVIFHLCKKRNRKSFSVISIHFFVHFMPVFLGDNHPKIDKYTQAFLVKVEQIKGSISLMQVSNYTCR